MRTANYLLQSSFEIEEAFYHCLRSLTLSSAADRTKYSGTGSSSTSFSLAPPNDNGN